MKDAEETEQETELNFNDNDIVFIIFNNRNDVISVRSIGNNLEIGNGYTLNSERGNGYSTQIAEKIANYVEDNNLLCYVFTYKDSVRDMWIGTGKFYLVENNNGNKFTGTFKGLNNKDYDLDKEYFVLRNNNCTSLFIFHNTNGHNMEDNRKKAERILNDIPKYNKIIINFKGNNGPEIKEPYLQSYELQNQGYGEYNDSFYKYVIKEYTEIEYRNIFIFCHGTKDDEGFNGGRMNLIIHKQQMI